MVSLARLAVCAALVGTFMSNDSAHSAVSTPTSVEKATVEVSRNSGLRQCSDESPAPEAFAKILKEHGVTVLSSACASDGAKRMQVCGADRGLFYIYEIAAEGLSKALELGFADVRQDAAASHFRKIPCSH
jgi:hypothetical protein